MKNTTPLRRPRDLLAEQIPAGDRRDAVLADDDELLPAADLRALMAIAKAQREAIDAAIQLAQPPQANRKGKPGLWRTRRIQIAADIQALLRRSAQ